MYGVDRSMLWEGEGLGVYQSVWDPARHQVARDVFVSMPNIAFTCRGVYRYRLGRRLQIGDVNTVTFGLPGREIGIEYPGKGTMVTRIELRDGSWREQLGEQFATGTGSMSARLSRPTHLRHRAMLATIMSDRDSVEVAESIFGVIRSTSEDSGNTQVDVPVISRSARRETRAINEQRINGVKEFIGVQFADPIRLSDIASCVHCSPFHLSRIFAQATGTSIGRYLILTRLRHAVHRLLEGESVRHTSTATGFASASHFCDMFRREYGRHSGALADLQGMLNTAESDAA